MPNKPHFEPIAIIGIGAIFPGSASAQGFWQAIANGVDLITDVPPTHWLIQDYYDKDPKAVDKTYCKRGAFISPVAFDPVEYGIPPANVPQTDTTQLLALMATKQLLIDAFGQDFDKTADLSRANVILGVTSAQELVVQASARLQQPIWRKALREAGVDKEIEERICQQVSNSYVAWGESMFPGLLGNVVSGRIANRFNFGGTNCVTDAACASSLAALSMAVDELQLGKADLAITGGADTFNDIFMYMCFSKTPALSMSGDCRPFAKSADGTILGEGIGLVALKRLSDAERDNNAIYAVIRGIGSASDGRSKSVYAPVAAGQAVAIQRSYEMAGFLPRTVELIEAHGTGTTAGDAAECEGLKLAFQAQPETFKPWCAIGSVKSQIGHTKAAAGAAALVKTIMALRHKVLPPTIKVDEPNPKLGLHDSPFYINTETRPWIRTQDYPRRAGVSAFGFGGTNFHVALEEYTGSKPAARLRTFPTELVLLSADSPEALIAKAQELEQRISADSDALVYLAKTSQLAFNPQQPARLALVASDAIDLINKLQRANAELSAKPLQTYAQKELYYNYGTQSGNTALLFPGQGSQYLNMGADLCMAFDLSQAVWDEADSIELERGVKLHEIVFPCPVFQKEDEQKQQTKLAQTEWTQPALAVTSLTQLALLQTLGVKADTYAGHSFGELLALHAAQVFDKTTLIKIARKRGELMAEAGRNIPGAMTAVICANSQALLEKIALWQIEVTPANYNSPEQIVFSGTLTAIQILEAKLQQEKISFRRLPVSTAFHSRIIEAAHKPFLDYLSTLTFNQPRQPVYANTSGSIYPEDPQQIKRILAEQLLHPVRFVTQIEAMYAAGIRTFIEVGPQGVLTNLVKKILTGKAVTTINMDNKGLHGITSLWNALGQLAVNGVKLDFTALWQDYREPAPPPSVEEERFTLTISGTNYGKPYPPLDDDGSLLEVNPNPTGHSRENLDPTEMTIERKEPMLHNHNKISGNGDHASLREDTLNKILNLYEKLQEEVTKAHLEYQEHSEKSHLAYLNEARAALDDIRQLALEVEAESSHAGEAVDRHPKELSVAPVIEPTSPVAAVNAPVAPAAPVVVQKMQAPPPVAKVESLPAAPQPVVPAPVIPVIAQPIVVAAVDTKVDAGMQDIILAIVADKTGYPQDTLSMDMDLEADLGIDSIKRVEILSAIQEKLPNLPELKPTELATLRTFEEIAAYIKKQPGV
ncbi:MAG TPA: beta-ketoacyl synthase N-terminal-like domain-containing protein [Gammaproteobacteria bacterium]|nr:beta-ketoacyl synthase N-terminal-like domain-containing protein [Gammaproteobacteria bacterium]